VPGIPLRDALCPPKRDGRIKSGHDDGKARPLSSDAIFKQPCARVSTHHLRRVRLHVSPQQKCEGAERRWTLPSLRDPPLPIAGEALGLGGVRPGVVSGRHPRTRPAALHAAVSVPGPFPINRRCAGFRVALVPAMAASYGGLPVVGAGRSTGASREWLARPSAGAASAPSWKRLPEDALTERT